MKTLFASLFTILWIIAHFIFSHELLKLIFPTFATWFVLHVVAWLITSITAPITLTIWLNKYHLLDE